MAIDVYGHGCRGMDVGGNKRARGKGSKGAREQGGKGGKGSRGGKGTKGAKSMGKDMAACLHVCMAAWTWMALDAWLGMNLDVYWKRHGHREISRTWTWRDMGQKTGTGGEQ